MKADLGRYGGLFPARALSQDFLWALRTGEMIEGLRNTLADGGYRITDVYRDFGSLLEEKERWHDLAELETAYLERLSALGLQDPCVEMLQNAESAEPPGGVERIVVACVPDPTPLMVRKLERLAPRIPIVVLVHAPEALADCLTAGDVLFRQVGAPRRRSDAEANSVLRLAWSQSQKVLELIARPRTVRPPTWPLCPMRRSSRSWKRTAAGLIPFNRRKASRRPLAGSPVRNIERRYYHPQRLSGTAISSTIAEEARISPARARRLTSAARPSAAAR
jgi:hypothetical protein